MSSRLAMALGMLALAAAGLSAAAAEEAVWTADGKLQAPTGYRQWTFLGSPLTPNALNDGKAAFPEFHNVYVPPAVLAEFMRTGEYPEGAVFAKELQLTLPQQFPDGSRVEASGRGFFPARFNGLDVMVKDSKRCAQTQGWCFFNFGHHAPPYETTAQARPIEQCAACHISVGDKNLHFSQFYPLLSEGRTP